MNYFYVYKDKVLVDTIKAHIMDVTTSGALLFADENYETIRIMVDGLWDDAQFKWKD